MKTGNIKHTDRHTATAQNRPPRPAIVPSDIRELSWDELRHYFVLTGAPPAITRLRSIALARLALARHLFPGTPDFILLA